MSKQEHKQTDEFEELYLRERKKSSLLIVAVITLAIATAGSLIWGASKQSSTPGGLPEGFQGQQDKGFGGRGGFRGGPGMAMDIKHFFKDDGSVDADQIDQLTSRLPSGMGSRFTDRIKEQADQAVKDGDITQAQADALKEKLDTVTESPDVN